MRKPDALPGTVLCAGPSEQFEDALVVLLGDATAVVGDVYVRAPRRFAGRDDDLSRAIARQVLHGIVDDIADDLFQGQRVGHQRRGSRRQGDFRADFFV